MTEREEEGTSTDLTDRCDNCGEIIETVSISNETLMMLGLFFCSDECAEEYVESK